jgi:hypothetical protein
VNAARVEQFIYNKLYNSVFADLEKGGKFSFFILKFLFFMSCCLHLQFFSNFSILSYLKGEGLSPVFHLKRLFCGWCFRGMIDIGGGGRG